MNWHTVFWPKLRWRIGANIDWPCGPAMRAIEITRIIDAAVREMAAEWRALAVD